MNVGDIATTIVGNLVAPPELRFTNDGKPVVNFTVAVNHRKFRSGEWVDDGSSFFRCTAWQNLATNIIETFPEKGMPIMVYGTVRMNRWEGEDGIKRDQAEMSVVAAGPNLMFSVASVSRPNYWGKAVQASDVLTEKSPENKADDKPSETPEDVSTPEGTAEGKTAARRTSTPRKRAVSKKSADTESE